MNFIIDKSSVNKIPISIIIKFAFVPIKIEENTLYILALSNILGREIYEEVKRNKIASTVSIIFLKNDNTNDPKEIFEILNREFNIIYSEEEIKNILIKYNVL